MLPPAEPPALPEARSVLPADRKPSNSELTAELAPPVVATAIALASDPAPTASLPVPLLPSGKDASK